MLLSPKLYDNRHSFKGTNHFDRDDNLDWNESNIAVLKHLDCPVKVYIDATHNSELKKWRRSGIKFDDLQIEGNYCKASLNHNSFGTYFNNNKDSIRVKLEFDNKHRLVAYKPNDSSNKTITTYDGLEKSNLPLEYKDKIKSYR